jgi:5'-nucleotidase (lipoprotein e(P4) family)
MKARLWQSLFLLNALITTEMIIAEDSKKDVRDLKEQNIMSVLYQQTAAERLAGSLQTFRSAKQALDNALADPTWSALPGQDIQGKKPAIIVDVDETVLDNTAYEARMILDGTKYPEGWVSWGKEAAASEVPGAKDFLNYAAAKGVTIFYVTNRVAELKEATKKNLTKLGIHWDSDKGPRRTLVGNEYRVLLMAGDNLGDFVDAKENNLSPSNRANIVKAYADYWGVKWFMLQNIAYGDWEGALYNFDYSLSPDEVHKTRLESLEPSRK